MYAEHSVIYETLGGSKRETISRKIFVSGYRILGTEHTRHEYYAGYDGWKGAEMAPVTKQFGHISEAQSWMDEMFSDWQVWLTQTDRGKHLFCDLVDQPWSIHDHVDGEV